MGGKWLALKLDAKEQNTIRQYLLGQLPQEDSARLEERLLIDVDFFQEVLIGEDELVDQYLGEQLSQAERQSFETHFLLAPEHQRRLRFARALHRYVDFAGTPEAQEERAAENVSDKEPDAAKPSAKRIFFRFLRITDPIVSYALAAVILLTVGGVAWLIFNNWRQQIPHQPGKLHVATLTPGLTRDGGESKRISIPPDIDTVQLRLELPSNRYRSYRAEVVDDEGKLIWSEGEIQSAVDTSPKFVELNIKRQLLLPGDYQVKVSGRLADGGTESIGSYPFRITP